MSTYITTDILTFIPLYNSLFFYAVFITMLTFLGVKHNSYIFHIRTNSHLGFFFFIFNFVSVILICSDLSQSLLKAIGHDG